MKKYLLPKILGFHFLLSAILLISDVDECPRHANIQMHDRSNVVAIHDADVVLVLMLEVD